MVSVLGIDPGSRITGYGVVTEEGGALSLVASGEIRDAFPGEPLAKRLLHFSSALSDIIARYSPDEMSIESVFCAKNVRSTVVMSHVRGVLLLGAASAGMPVAEYSPMEIKKAVTGYGSAEKAQVQQMVRALLALREAPRVDEADAIAAAICHLHSRRLSAKAAQGMGVAGVGRRGR